MSLGEFLVVSVMLVLRSRCGRYFFSLFLAYKVCHFCHLPLSLFFASLALLVVLRFSFWLLFLNCNAFDVLCNY